MPYVLRAALRLLRLLFTAIVTVAVAATVATIAGETYTTADLEGAFEGGGALS